MSTRVCQIGEDNGKDNGDTFLRGFSLCITKKDGNGTIVRFSLYISFPYAIIIEK